jgi:hypothetical protein
VDAEPASDLDTGSPATVAVGAPPSAVREVVRARPRRPSARVPSPVSDDLFAEDDYGQTLLSSLIRAQLGVTVSVLLPAAVLLCLYPLLAVLIPSIGRATVLGVPLALILLGGGIYPPLILLGVWYVRRAERLEQRFSDLLQDE